MNQIAPGDRKVIQCNYTEGTNIAAQGARAYVVLPNPGGGHDRIQVLVRSRGGRWVQKYEAISRLAHFRVKTMPLEHPLYARQLWSHDPERYIQEFCDAKRHNQSRRTEVTS